MKFILQLHTGSFGHASIEPMRATAILTRLMDLLDTKAVIWGWARDRAVNDAITTTLARRGVPGYLWLPVFSETVDSLPHDGFEMLSGAPGKGIELNADEKFEFVCPSSQRNIANAIAMFEQVMQGLPCAGVFLDRIRYPSAANSVYALAGCQCGRCRTLYAQHGVDMATIAPLFDAERAAFLPTAVEKGCYTFENEVVTRLFAAKRRIITDAVQALCEHFHALGMQVGIDTFAPAVADYVGQDNQRIAEMVDFVKPMMYRRTDAPAGIGFEVRAIETGCGADRLRLAEAWGSPLLAPEATVMQLQALQQVAGNVSPGIEVNTVPGVCNTSPAYVRESLRIAQQAGCDSIVLSWNVSMMDESILETLRTL